MVISSVVYAGIGYVVGAFTPAVGRTIKSWFVKESKVVVADAKANATVAAVETAVEKKL